MGSFNLFNAFRSRAKAGVNRRAEVKAPAALRSFARTRTAEFAGKGIRANIISPGPTDTPIVEGQFGGNTDAMKERFKTMTPVGRMGKPEEVASTAVFLASDDCIYITGIDVPVDGANPD